MVTSCESFMTLQEHRWGVLKQRSYARDNEEFEFIPTSLMTGKDSWRFTTEKEADFTIGGGGVFESIYKPPIPLSCE